jgi:uncharacterized protein YdbL (DUF1318 family)
MPMKTLKFTLFLCTLLIIGSCVTINVYFPAASAQKAAEEFVGDVLGEPVKDGSRFTPDDPRSGNVLLFAGQVLDFFVSSAHAQQVEIDINTPQINAIKAHMVQRQRDSLNAFFDAGAIGFSNDGLVVLRDRAAVPLSDRRNLESIVAAENRDRTAVYREIAVANGHPEWEADIQKIFAREWVANARKGWYYQDASGAWLQKN